MQRLILGLFLPGLLVAGCASQAPDQSALMERTGTLTATSAELRLRVYDVAVYFARNIESAADSIRRATDDPAISDLALRWKSRSVPEIYLAAFQRDPLGGAWDLIAFHFQMQDYLTTGAGRDAFGEHQPIALRAVARVDSELDLLRRSVVEDPAVISGAAEEWAAEHPLTSMGEPRPSTRSDWAAYADRAGMRGGLSGVASMEVLLDDMNQRISLLAATLPRQIQWQAEVTLREFLRNPQAAKFLEDVDGAEESLDRVAVFLEALPLLLDERMADIDRLLEEQRGAVLGDVDRQRMETLLLLQAEREALTLLLENERRAVLAGTELAGGRLLVETRAELEGVIDHLFLRAVQFSLGLAVLVGLGTWWFTRRRRT